MEPRHRERFRQLPFGAVTFPGPGGPKVAGPRQIKTLEQTCDDYWHKTRRMYDLTGSGLPPSDLSMTTVRRKWTPLNGGVNDSVWWFHQYPPDIVGWHPIAHFNPPPGKDKGNNAYALKLLQRTNPLRPAYSVPVAIREMAELTMLFSFMSKSFASFVGSAYLNYRFGWLSFLNDVRTLAKIVEIIQSRVRELNSLKQHGGLRRRTDLDSYAVPWSGTDTIQSAFGVTMQSNTHASTRWKIWGSVRWYPTNLDLIPSDPGDAWLFAIRQVFDLEQIDPNTMWNLIPWSWLIDYFTNIGDIFAATEGRSVVEPRDICIMRELHTVVVGKRKPVGTLGDKIVGGDFHFSRVTKTRTVVANPDLTIRAFDSLISMSEYKVILALLAKFRG